MNSLLDRVHYVKGHGSRRTARWLENIHASERQMVRESAKRHIFAIERSWAQQISSNFRVSAEILRARTSKNREISHRGSPLARQHDDSQLEMLLGMAAQRAIELKPNQLAFFMQEYR